MRAFNSQENLYDFEEMTATIEPEELDLECCEILYFTKPVDNTGNSSIVNIPNQIIQE